VKAREFLVRKQADFTLRDLIKRPLTAAELKKLAKRVGGAENLVAPKRRAEADGLKGDALIAWLSEDGARVRRPIVDTGEDVTLGFAKDAQEALDGKL
jgi:arsenate reductase-like glutaredoxin family protein